MSKKILINSIQYSPIYKSLSLALGKQCLNYGYDVKYIFSQEYEWMIDSESRRNSLFIGHSRDSYSSLRDGLNRSYKKQIRQYIKNETPSHIYMINYHPFFNPFVARVAKKSGITFVQHVHEPYVENKSVYGFSYLCMLYLFEYLQGLLLRNADIAVLSSDTAVALFDRRYPKFTGKKMLVPLLHEDLARGSTNTREYICFVGPLIPSKGPEIFLKIAEYAEKHGLGYKFLLISRAKITGFKNKNIEIFHKERISDEEMADLMSKSIITITPYKTARQSSVVITSYMCGTPVLSSDIEGLKEAVIHLKTGYRVDLGSDIEQWIEGIRTIENNFTELSRNCREKFISEYSENNWQKYLKYILEV